MPHTSDGAEGSDSEVRVPRGRMFDSWHRSASVPWFMLYPEELETPPRMSHSSVSNADGILLPTAWICC